MKSRCHHNSTKKGFMIFFAVTLRPFIKYHSSRPCFPSRNITKNAETHPPPMRDVIIEQPSKIKHCHKKDNQSFYNLGEEHY